MRRDIIINGALLFGSIAVFFFGIEAGLRFTGLQTVKPNPPRIYRTSENPAISYELIPNLRNVKAYRSKVSTDERGFRIGDSLTLALPQEERKIFVVLGDSATFGYGVEGDETLPAKLEKFIPEYRFVNAAVPGFTLTQEVATYVEKVADLDPEALAIVFHFNDLDGNPPGILDPQGILRPYGWKPEDPRCEPVDRGILGMIPGRCWLDIHSAFYKAVKKFVNMRYNNEKLEEDRVAAQEEEAMDPVEPAHLQAYIAELAEFTLSLPPNLQRTFIIWPDRELHKESRQTLIDATKRLGFTVVDLYDTFGNRAPTLGWDTVHPHRDTIEKAADVIAAKIREGKKPDL